MITETIAWPELMTFVVGTLALINKYFVIRDCLFDVDRAQLDQRRDTQLLAEDHLRTALVLFSVKALLVILAFWGMATPSANPTVPTSWLLMFSHIVMTSIILALFFASFMSRRTQKQILANAQAAPDPFLSVNDRFEEVDQRLARIEEQLNRLIATYEQPA